jgi:hypothetical protein
MVSVLYHGSCGSLWPKFWSSRQDKADDFLHSMAKESGRIFAPDSRTPQGTILQVHSVKITVTMSRWVALIISNLGSLYGAG